MISSLRQLKAARIIILSVVILNVITTFCEAEETLFEHKLNSLYIDLT